VGRSDVIRVEFGGEIGGRVGGVGKEIGNCEDGEGVVKIGWFFWSGF
jgi:hypothetical protein